MTVPAHRRVCMVFFIFTAAKQTPLPGAAAALNTNRKGI